VPCCAVLCHAELTFSVNFWWDSPLSLLLKSQPHQHTYLLRQLMMATSSRAVQALIDSVAPWTPQTTTAVAAAEAEAAAAAAEAAAGEAPSSKRRRRDTRTGEQQQQEQGKGQRHSLTCDLGDDAVPQGSGQQGSEYDSGQGLGGQGLSEFESAALQTLLGGAGSNPQQQQQQQGSSVLVGEAWWQRQQAAQQQLLSGAVSSSNSRRSSSSWACGPGRVAANKQQQQQEEEGGGAGDVLGLSHPVTRVLAALQPVQLLRVLWQGAVQSPGAVAQLLLRGLNPAAAQLLTNKLEAADGLFDTGPAAAAAAAAEVSSVLGGQQGGVRGETSGRSVSTGTGGPPPKGEASPQLQQQRQQQQQPGEKEENCEPCESEVPPSSPHKLQQPKASGFGHSCEGGCGHSFVGFSREEFYGRVYGCVDDPGEVLQVLLQQKTLLVDVVTDVLLRAQLGRM